MSIKMQVTLITALAGFAAAPAHAATVDDCSGYTAGTSGLPSYMPADSCAPVGTDICTISGAVATCDLSAAPAAVQAQAVGLSGGTFEYMVWGTIQGGSGAFCCLIDDDTSPIDTLTLVGSAYGDTLRLRYDDAGNPVELTSPTSGFQGRLLGEGGNDILHGSDILDDFAFGGAGNDSIRGFGGEDLLLGGDGIDDIGGGEDDDKMWGGEGDDCMAGHAGADLMIGDGGNDVMLGYTRTIPNFDCENLDVSNWEDTGCDDDFGADGIDKMWGDDGDDILYGCSGNDIIQGGSGYDEIFGNSGRDKLCDGPDSEPASVDVFFAGGTGNDQIRYGDQNHGTISLLGIVTSGGTTTGFAGGSDAGEETPDPGTGITPADDDLCDPFYASPNPIVNCERFKNNSVVFACDPGEHPTPLP